MPSLLVDPHFSAHCFLFCLVSAQASLFLGSLRDTSDTPKLQNPCIIFLRLSVLAFREIPFFFFRGQKIVIPHLPFAAHTLRCTGFRADVLLFQHLFGGHFMVFGYGYAKFLGFGPLFSSLAFCRFYTIFLHQRTVSAWRAFYHGGLGYLVSLFPLCYRETNGCMCSYTGRDGKWDGNKLGFTRVRWVAVSKHWLLLMMDMNFLFVFWHFNSIFSHNSNLEKISDPRLLTKHINHHDLSEM